MILNLGSAGITTAVTGTVITSAASDLTGTTVAYLDGQGDLTALSVCVRFTYGSGGTTCKAWLQTSFGDGQPWHDIACGAFTTSTGCKIFNLSGLTPKTTPATPTEGLMDDDSALDGILGDRYRVKITTTGTYVATTIDVKASSR